MVQSRESVLDRVCNGSPRFCHLHFDEFTFTGTHNSGTREASRNLNCFFKNQDLSIREQLDLGIRFFDLDIIYRCNVASLDIST